MIKLIKHEQKREKTEESMLPESIIHEDDLKLEV